MPIADADIQWFKSAHFGDPSPALNGGRLSADESPGAVRNNIFGDVMASERESGKAEWRKLFILVRNADDLPLRRARISIEIGTPGESHVLLYPGTWTDTESTRSGRPYGYGVLAASAESGDSSITVTTEADFSALSAKPFQAGDLVRVDARANVLATGLSETVEVASVAYTGDQLTLGLVSGLANSYAAGVHVASVIEAGDLETTVTALAVTGDLEYDDTAHPIVVPQIGAMHQTWTLTVTNAATGTLSLAGDTLGAVGTGAMGADLEPANPSGGVYFQLPAAGWGGTPATGDTLTLTTFPAGCALWYQRVVPSGAAAILSGPVSVCVEGESA